jgi:O-antigen/teichoic acid export membrane protein
MLLAGPAVGLLFGAEFLPSVPAFRILAAAMVFLGVGTMLSNYLAATGFPWFAVHAWLGATVLNVALNLVLIPAAGIAGAALASLVCYAAVLVALWLYALGDRGRRQEMPTT